MLPPEVVVVVHEGVYETSKKEKIVSSFAKLPSST